MTYTLLIIALLVAGLDWYAVIVKNRRLEFFAKPATMLLLLAWFIQNGGLQAGLLWFFVGGVLSLAGDVFLMLPREQFIAGLVAFLLAHVAYIAGFNPNLPGLHPLTIGLALLLAAFITWLYGRIRRGLEQQGKPQLKLPVLIYSIVISVMVLSAAACFTRPDWPTAPAAIVTFGALSFMLSDVILAWNKFVKPLSWGRPVNMATYHLGQVGILLGVLLYFS